MRNTKGLCGRAQRTHGTTDPGGVWHPVHRRECLTILLGTYAENGQCNRPTTNCIVFGTACLCLCLHSYRLVLRVDRTPVQDWFIRVSETGCAINEGFFSQVYLLSIFGVSIFKGLLSIPCDGRGARRPQGQSFHESVGPAYPNLPQDCTRVCARESHVFTHLHPRRLVGRVDQFKFEIR